MGDGRELFVIETNLEITAFSSGYCIESSFGNTAEGSKIQT